MARSFIVYQGEDETPEFDLTDSDSPVHVIWEEIEAGGRAFQGESTTNSIPVRDEQGGTGNELSLPSGVDFISLSRGSRWVWMDGPDGDEVILASGRIGTKDYSRGRQKADRAREVTVQAADRNEELTEIIIDDWVRPEETDVARVNALITAYLSGTPRATTVLANTYVASGNTVTMPAKTYDGTNPKDVLSEIALQANKLFFVTVDDEVFYDTADATTYLAGIRISDRLDEIDTETVCSPGSSGSILRERGAQDYGNSLDMVDQVIEGAGDDMIVVFVAIRDDQTISTVEWTPDSATPASKDTFTQIGSTVTIGTIKLSAWYLFEPRASVQVAGGIIEPQLGGGNGANAMYMYYLTGVSSSTVVSGSDTDAGSSVSSAVAAGTGYMVLDAVAWQATHGTADAADAGPGQTEDYINTGAGAFGDPDSILATSHKADATEMSWSGITSSGHYNGAAHIAVGVAGAAGSVSTFPPIWDVGPASTEDGLELVSGLRLYYGQDGAYVYVNHTDTANSYWWAERSFYTQDPAINDSTKATALANAMLTRLRFEERTYNVSIGPLGVEQVGCIKPGQLIDIKARAIPDADDQFRSRRIAQLKWTTPRPGVFFARMQLDRPIKELPYGIGAKEGHDALENHKEGDSHPASAIVITDSGGFFDATDVEAALQELGAASGATSTVIDHGSMGAAETFDFTDGSDHEGTQDADLTVTLTGATTGEAAWLTLVLTQDGTGGHSLTLPGSVVNAATIETAWDQTPSTVNVLTLFTYDGGTAWYGFLAGGSGSSVGALDDLSDVTITTPAEGDDLRFDGSAWVNDSRKWEAVTDGADTFVWEGDDLVHDWSV